MLRDLELFEQDADVRWSDTSHCTLLHSIAPARLSYLCLLLREQFGKELHRVNILDVGCGGGLFAEEVARLGCQITGVDLSPRTIKVAQRHAEKMGLPITYHVASGEYLPFHYNTIDLVYCCDVLEHISDVNAVIAGSADKAHNTILWFFERFGWLSPSEEAIRRDQENFLKGLIQYS